MPLFVVKGGMEMQQSSVRLAIMFLSLGTAGQAAFAQGTNAPKLFAAGVISGPADDFSPSFSPGGNSLFFTRSNGSGSVILMSKFQGGRWTTPEIAPFSGTWSDIEPAMAADGSFLVFASNRPATDGGKAIDGFFNGKTFLGRGGNLWRVNRTGNGWSRPERLPDTVNQTTATFSPSISADGSIYFMRTDEHSGKFHLYRSQYNSGRYLAAAPLGIGDDTTDDVDPAVAPDQSFLVYSSNQPSKGGPKRLRIVFREKDGWGSPIDLGDEVNEEGSNIEARLSPDQQTLYFSTNTVPPVVYPRSIERAKQDLADMNVWATGRHNIWYVSLTPWLKVDSMRNMRKRLPATVARDSLRVRTRR